MIDDTAMQEILDNPRGHRVKTILESGERVTLRRAHNGIQILFPERIPRPPMTLGSANQQSKLEISQE